MLALVALGGLGACKRTAPIDPQQQQENTRQAAIASVSLPEARSTRAAAPPHIRVVITADAIDLDNLLVARGRTGVAPVVRSRVVQLENGAYRASDLRGGEHGFLAEALRDAFAELRRPFDSDASAQPAVRVGIYAASNISAYTLYRTLYTISQTGALGVHLMLRRASEHVALELALSDALGPGVPQDCWHYNVFAGTEDSKIAARLLYRGETFHSAAMRGSVTMMAAITGERDAGADAATEAPTSSERALTMNGGAIDLDACVTELRSMQTTLGRQTCDPITIVVDKRLPYGALIALQERLQTDVSRGPLAWGLRN